MTLNSPHPSSLKKSTHRHYESRHLVVDRDEIKKQSKEEQEYPRLHKCRDNGEAYGASYLITKDHLINQFTGPYFRNSSVLYLIACNEIKSLQNLPDLYVLVDSATPRIILHILEYSLKMLFDQVIKMVPLNDVWHHDCI